MARFTQHPATLILAAMPAEQSLSQALDEAADLFDAGLYFEVHELLEPYWMRAQAEEREILQGVIQVAAGLHHLRNGNLNGTRSLLAQGILKLLGRTLEGRPLGGFTSGISLILDAVATQSAESGQAVGWKAVPRFPRKE